MEIPLPVSPVQIFCCCYLSILVIACLCLHQSDYEMRISGSLLFTNESLLSLTHFFTRSINISRAYLINFLLLLWEVPINSEALKKTRNHKLPVLDVRIPNSVSPGLNQSGGRAAFLPDAAPKNPFPCLIPVSEAPCNSWLLNPQRGSRGFGGQNSLWHFSPPLYKNASAHVDNPQGLLQFRALT